MVRYGGGALVSVRDNCCSCCWGRLEVDEELRCCVFCFFFFFFFFFFFLLDDGWADVGVVVVVVVVVDEVALEALDRGRLRDLCWLLATCLEITLGLNFLFLDEEVVVLALSLFQLDMIHVKLKRGFSRLKSSSALQINVDDQVHEQK